MNNVEYNNQQNINNRMMKLKAMELKSAAFTLFAKKGYDAASVNEIAQAAGLKKASFYTHFSSKKQVYIELFREQADKYKELLKNEVNMTESHCLEDMLLEILKGAGTFFAEKERLWFWKRALMIITCKSNEDLFDEMVRIVKEMDSEFFGLLFQLYRKAYDDTQMDNEEVKASITAFGFLLHGFLDWLAVYEGDDINNVINTVWNSTFKKIR